MIIALDKARFKKIAIGFLLLLLAQWYNDGLIICYGADGHLAMTRPSSKSCCKTPEADSTAAASIQATCDPCIDVPILPADYITSSAHSTLFHHNIAHPAICEALSASQDLLLCTLGRQEIPPPHNPLLASLKTIVLLI